MPSSPSTIKEIKTTLEGIGHILSDRRLAVPPYQRSYAWNRGQSERSLSGSRRGDAEGLDEYFLGSIVLIREKTDPKRPQLVDGQQRLATATNLSLVSIRDHFVTTGEIQRADTIETKYLFLRDLRSQELIPRLQLNQIDHEYFVKLSPIQTGKHRSDHYTHEGQSRSHKQGRRRRHKPTSQTS